MTCVIGLWAIYSYWFCKFSCSKLEAPHFCCKNELVGGKKIVLVTCMSRINVISIYASIFFLENQTSSMLKHSNPAHHCSTAQTKIMGPLLSKLHNLQYYVHILPRWVSSKTNFPLLNMLTLQMKFSFLHNVSPPKLTVYVFLKFCYNPPLKLVPSVCQHHEQTEWFGLQPQVLPQSSP